MIKVGGGGVADPGAGPGDDEVRDPVVGLGDGVEVRDPEAGLGKIMGAQGGRGIAAAVR